MARLRRITLAGFLVVGTYIAPASAEVLAECGASTGMAYDLEGGRIQEGKGGWREDAISNGGFSLVKNGDGVDIIYVDANKKPRSAKADGAIVDIHALGPKDPAGRNLGVLEMYPSGGVVISYVFRTKGGYGEVVYTTTRVKTEINKGSVMRAKCTFPAP